MLIKPIILASASPRRHELLTACGIPFRVLIQDIDENVEQPLPADKFVAAISRKKAEAAAEACRKNGQTDSTILAADTVVAIDGEILGKPRDETHAFEMLGRLSGRTHSVYTGLTFAYLSAENTSYKQKVCETRVTFKALSEEQIREHIATGEPLDKAGAYGIQGLGGAFVAQIDGDYNNVVGLPIDEVVKELLG